MPLRTNLPGHLGSRSTNTARIASASGSAADRRHGLAELARNEDIQYIVGDWMSEYNMALRGGGKADDPNNSSEFEPSFLEAVEPALAYLDARRIKLAVNAGASDTKKLHDLLVEMVKEKDLKLKIAWIEGDEVIDVVRKGLGSGEGFTNLTTGENIKDWPFEPIYAQAYLGCWGIVEAFKQGAHIVVCGRVADASPTIACAAYHYNWRRNDYSQLAHALVAGHLIECTTYVTGGNFSGFKSLAGTSVDIGFPIAEFEANGEFCVYRQARKGGMVTVETCKAQLLYEIQGPYYYNSDVVAVLDNIKMSHVGENRVRVFNVGNIKPPPTTKVGITAKGGYQAEAHYFLCGLDTAEKATLFERQLRHVLDEASFSCLKFRTNGSCPENPSNQDAATVDLRIFAQARDQEALSPLRFLKPIVDNIMQSYPGATFHLDTRQAFAKEYYEYWVSIIPQSAARHVCHLPWKAGRVEIEPPADTVEFVYEQPSYETESPVNLSSLGPATTAPLGYVVHARSGDKGSDSNVGFFVRNADEWDWLRSLLTVSKIRELLGEDDKGKPIFRFELPHLFAVHFLLKDHLDRGVTASSSYDFLSKNLAEYLRCKHVSVPDRYLARGRI
ncbi:Putative acyclic terpene utilization [Colletotrichum destructivum]|uniref:Acyclic terpene utilization n=1 Tax=Colletotrichum destructivum TaxID=34406 RepID=A0AAX4I641_9PEZI|nr:Putative acyclic terpene utilization [Colletotrichum destructivum]